MAPRKYSMGKRAKSVARTRARIVDAAMALYREQPVETTSMQDVAKRADVAPGTVLNHFPEPEALTEAVVAAVLERLRPPSGELFGGCDTAAERLRALARALATFYERAEPWFQVHERERDRTPAFARGAREFDVRVVSLIREALGGTVEGPERQVLAVQALLSPPVFGGLRARGGLSAEEAADLVTEILMAWLHSQRYPNGLDRVEPDVGPSLQEVDG